MQYFFCTINKTKQHVELLNYESFTLETVENLFLLVPR